MIRAPAALCNAIAYCVTPYYIQIPCLSLCLLHRHRSTCLHLSVNSYTSYNYQPATSTSTAPTPAPAQGPERYSSYSPHAQPAPSSSVPPYQRFRAPQPTSATSAAALARYSAMQASMTAPRPVPASSTSFPSPSESKAPSCSF